MLHLLGLTSRIQAQVKGWSRNMTHAVITATSRLSMIKAAPQRHCYPGIERFTNGCTPAALPRAESLLGAEEKQALLKNAGVTLFLVPGNGENEVEVWSLSTCIPGTDTAAVAAARDLVVALSFPGTTSNLLLVAFKNYKRITTSLLHLVYFSMNVVFFFTVKLSEKMNLTQRLREDEAAAGG